MAKRLEGITIVIDGETKKLNDALKGTQSVISATNNEIKQLNQALKLDPKNTELLSQKQEVLKNNIAATTEKLNTLKDAQKQMGDYNSLTDAQKESYRSLSVEIAKSENALKNMNEELKGMNKVDLSKVKDTLKKVGEVALDVVKKVGQVTAAVGGAMAGVVAAGVKSFAELEQNVGGVETLFGDNAQKVMDNAAKAFQTAGVSANEYMKGVTSFSASLLQSLGGDTAKAADIADMAFRDMSDNANKFGTDMSSIQNAYQGFAKQNYTMLDNLKLGYGGTKKEMERLLQDAEKFSGVHYDISNLSDVYNAIHVIQEELGVTGTTAEEASTTISGSAASMKAAFDNFLNGSGSPEQLATAVTTFLGNVTNAIGELAPQILTGISTLLETLIPQVATMLFNLIPQLLDAITNLINKLFDMVSKNTTAIRKAVTELIKNFVNFVTQNLPTIIELGLALIVALATGIGDSLPELIPTIIDCIMTIVDVIIDNLDMIIMAAIDIILALAQGLIDALPRLLAKIPEIIVKLQAALTNPEMLAKLISGAITLALAIATGLIKAIPEIVKAVPKIIKGLFDNFIKLITETDWKKLGKDILNGILNGMLNFGNVVKDTIKKVGNKITSSIKSFFGIKSPSRLMSKEVGENLTAGIAMGFEKGIPETIRDVNAAMTDLNNGIQSSMNPIINPTANSNPLIIQIENFNNTRQQDVQALAEELEFYRKNSALARGGN